MQTRRQAKILAARHQQQDLPPARLSLLGLPAELHNRIFKEVINRWNVKQPRFMLDPPAIYIGRYTTPALLRTWQQIRNEARGLFFASKAFVVAGFHQYRALANWLRRSVGLDMLKVLRTIYISNERSWDAQEFRGSDDERAVAEERLRWYHSRLVAEGLEILEDALWVRRKVPWQTDPKEDWRVTWTNEPKVEESGGGTGVADSGSGAAA